MFAIGVFGKRKKNSERLDSFVDAENRVGWNIMIQICFDVARGHEHSAQNERT